MLTYADVYTRLRLLCADACIYSTNRHTPLTACLCIYVYICMYVCIYKYIYIYIYILIFLFKNLQRTWTRSNDCARVTLTYAPITLTYAPNLQRIWTRSNDCSALASSSALLCTRKSAVSSSSMTSLWPPTSPIRSSSTRVSAVC